MNENRIHFPKYVMNVLFTLRARGYTAYLVGGCVRDVILGKRPNDWDICTSALPGEIMEVFPDSRPTGIKHGTVTVISGGNGVEVTTFRSEGGYSDHRHPDDVNFVGDLTTDLSRRDFTINAIALSDDGVFVDPFGGIDDIDAKIIRCVGAPELRFEEDALRMFRALRFSARLGFDIEENTMAGIYGKAPLAASIATERIREELEKLLMTDRPEMFQHAISSGLLDPYLLRRGDIEKELALLSSLPKKIQPRLMALCWLLERHDMTQSSEAFLIKLRSDNYTIRNCTDGVHILRNASPVTDADWKRLLSRYGVETVTYAARCADVFRSGRGRLSRVRSVLRSGDCFSLSRLAVNGSDLKAMGLNGKEIGEMLTFLLDYVIDHPESNRRELLLSIACPQEDI